MSGNIRSNMTSPGRYFLARNNASSAIRSGYYLISIFFEVVPY